MNLSKPFAAASETLESDAAAQPVSFSWDALLQGNAQPSGKRRLIAVVPVLTAGELEPGLEATDAIRRSRLTLHLASKFRANIRLTGPVPSPTRSFATHSKGLSLNSIVTDSLCSSFFGQL